MALSDYQATSSDWRAQLTRNHRKTQGVIATFVAIYLVVGLIVDLALVQAHYPQLTLFQSLYLLSTFRIIPWGLLIMTTIAIFSLFIAYGFYDKIMLLGTNSYEINPCRFNNLQEQQLYNVIEEMKVASGIRFMPKVYIIEADYMNAFASGYSEKSAMVAITRGLMTKLNRAELQAVMAHEISHIRHQDTKLTLTVAVLSNLLLIAIDILFNVFLFRRGKRENNSLFAVILLLRYVLPVITILLTLFLSRTREYMADSGAVELMRDNEPMARALLKIAEDYNVNQAKYGEEHNQTAHEAVRQAAYLFNPKDTLSFHSLTNAFSTHPDIEQRLKAIGYLKRN